MALRRFWAQNAQLLPDQKIRIEGDLWHHIVNVCRFDFQEPFELLGIEDSLAWKVTLVEKGKKYAIVELMEKRPLPPLPRPWIHLLLCVPKASTLEIICEKCVEIGAYALYLASNDYSFFKNPERINHLRLEKIITQAQAQTGRWQKFSVYPLKPLFDWIHQLRSSYPNSLWIWADETAPTGPSLRAHLRRVQEKSQFQDIFLIVGSEGGFSPPEIQTLAQMPIERVSLGFQVLRVETACLLLMAAVKYEWELL